MKVDATFAIEQFCRATGLPAPVREFRFHESRRWRFDLCWEAERVALEIQGGVWTGGRHSRGAGQTKDCEKLSEAAALGWRVLLATPQQVKSGAAFGWLERALSGGR